MLQVATHNSLKIVGTGFKNGKIPGPLSATKPYKDNLNIFRKWALLLYLKKRENL